MSGRLSSALAVSHGLIRSAGQAFRVSRAQQSPAPSAGDGRLQRTRYCRATYDGGAVRHVARGHANAYRPETLDSRRPSVRVDTPTRSPSTGWTVCAQSHDGPLSGHTREHIRRPDPLGTLPTGKEDLQVAGHRQHRARSALPGQELRIIIEQPNAEADLRVAGRADRDSAGSSSSRSLR
jgi:hypothetical protein